jgi:hypothetical protein
MARCSEAPIQLSLGEWLSCHPTATAKQGNVLLDDLAHFVYPHSFHSRISLSKSHLPLNIVEWDIFFRPIEGPEVWSGTTYVALENSIESTILLCEALVFVTAIHKALKDITERIDSFENFNLRVIRKRGRQCLQVPFTTGKEPVDIFSETGQTTNDVSAIAGESGKVHARFLDQLDEQTAYIGNKAWDSKPMTVRHVLPGRCRIKIMGCKPL